MVEFLFQGRWEAVGVFDGLDGEPDPVVELGVALLQVHVTTLSVQMVGAFLVCSTRCVRPWFGWGRQHSITLTARPPREVSLYLSCMSRPVSRMVVMTLASATVNNNVPP
ncbi:hypothetical protein GCM10027294_29370 [Marinactinospora endophytica]